MMRDCRGGDEYGLINYLGKSTRLVEEIYTIVPPSCLNTILKFELPCVAHQYTFERRNFQFSPTQSCN